MYSFENIKKFLLDKWWIFALVGVFLFAYWIRSVGNIPDRILSFDPVFFYRFTNYFADWGHFPVWDELSFYVGRADTPTNSPLMEMVTATVYNFFKGSLSLFTVASQMSAIYGALIVFPAFLLGRELSNKYGGLFAAALIGSAPQILIRTFGASYDTDQVAVFFLILTLYAGFRCLRKKTTESLAIAILAYSAAMLSWGNSMFTFVILCGYSVVLLVMQKIFGKFLSYDGSNSINNFKWNVVFLFAILAATQFVGIITKSYDAIGSIISIANFAVKKVWIVNESIAELQPFDVLNIQGWMQAVGRFATGDGLVDSAIFSLFLAFMFVGLFYSYKKKINSAPLITAIFIIAFFVTTSGIRFTEFSSGLFLLIIAAGFGYAVEFFEKRSMLARASVFGVAMIIIFFAFGISSQLGYALGADKDSDWDNAWKWIKENTPEDAIIGTWWDPGHMIAGYAERRNFADGAHCPNTCKYTMNDRIVDLGKIMATSDENISLRLIQKYRGTSSKVYWIASDDLIPKFQWLQYYGMACDSRKEPQKCALYQALPLKGEGKAEDGNLIMRNYGSILLFETQPKIAVYHQDGLAFIFGEIITHSDGQLQFLTLNQNLSAQAYGIITPILQQLKLKSSNQTLGMTVWIPEDFGYIAIIPPNLRNSVFTKMFFFEGDELEHFKKVYRNNKVKIYEVIP